MSVYYNDNDPYCAAWLRNLAARDLIPEGTIDDRDIRHIDKPPTSRHAHFFAGIGGWAYALRLADWPADREVWTASLPCQPFSSAGDRAGETDDRHLWPAFHALLAQRRPATIFGEQVASHLGREWLAGVHADLADLGYAVGAADLPAGSVGAPHLRRRLYWVADTDHRCEGLERRSGAPVGDRGACDSWLGPRRGGPVDGMADTPSERDRPGTEITDSETGIPRTLTETPDRRHMGDTDGVLSEQRHTPAAQRDQRPLETPGAPWAGAEWIECADRKLRRVEPRIRLLADGIPSRVDRIRALGNSIVPQVAAQFVTAHQEVNR